MEIMKRIEKNKPYSELEIGKDYVAEQIKEQPSTYGDGTQTFAVIRCAGYETPFYAGGNAGKELLEARKQLPFLFRVKEVRTKKGNTMRVVE